MVAANLKRVLERIEEAAHRSGRSPAEVSLVAVTKGRSDTELLEAYDAGQRDFGENRADGLGARLQADLPGDIRWHFIGTVQRRKAKLLAPHVHLLHSVDRLVLGREWVKRTGGPALLQVNISGEEQKHGFAPEATVAAAVELASAGLDVRGLMGMAAFSPEPEDARPAFVLLAELSRELRAVMPNAGEISMGMTDDFEVAVESGATIVRVGRAIFDPSG